MPIIRNNFWKLLFSGFQRSWILFMVSFCLFLKSLAYLCRNSLLIFFILVLQSFKFYHILFMLESIHNLCEVHDLSFMFFYYCYNSKCTNCMSLGQGTKKLRNFPASPTHNRITHYINDLLTISKSKIKLFFLLF